MTEEEKMKTQRITNESEKEPVKGLQGVERVTVEGSGSLK